MGNGYIGSEVISIIQGKISKIKKYTELITSSFEDASKLIDLEFNTQTGGHSSEKEMLDLTIEMTDHFTAHLNNLQTIENNRVNEYLDKHPSLKVIVDEIISSSNFDQTVERFKSFAGGENDILESRLFTDGTVTVDSQIDKNSPIRRVKNTNSKINLISNPNKDKHWNYISEPDKSRSSVIILRQNRGHGSNIAYSDYLNEMIDSKGFVKRYSESTLQDLFCHPTMIELDRIKNDTMAFDITLMISHNGAINFSMAKDDDTVEDFETKSESKYMIEGSIIIDNIWSGNQTVRFIVNSDNIINESLDMMPSFVFRLVNKDDKMYLFMDTFRTNQLVTFPLDHQLKSLMVDFREIQLNRKVSCRDIAAFITSYGQGNIIPDALNIHSMNDEGIKEFLNYDIDSYDGNFTVYPAYTVSMAIKDNSFDTPQSFVLMDLTYEIAHSENYKEFIISQGKCNISLNDIPFTESSNMRYKKTDNVLSFNNIEYDKSANEYVPSMTYDEIRKKIENYIKSFGHEGLLYEIDLTINSSHDADFKQNIFTIPDLFYSECGRYNDGEFNLNGYCVVNNGQPLNADSEYQLNELLKTGVGVEIFDRKLQNGEELTHIANVPIVYSDKHSEHPIKFIQENNNAFNPSIHPNYPIIVKVTVIGLGSYKNTGVSVISYNEPLGDFGTTDEGFEKQAIVDNII